jgi:hypothetical protein
MAIQSVNLTSRSGIDLTALAVVADPAGADKWLNSGFELVAVTNGTGYPLSVSERLGTNPGAAVDGLSPSPRVVTVAAGHTAVLGPFPQSIYNDAQGFATLGWSGPASLVGVTVCVFRPGT